MIPFGDLQWLNQGAVDPRGGEKTPVEDFGHAKVLYA
jgi:hypothetical protein